MCQHFLFGTNLTDHEDLSHVSFNISTCYSPQNFRICVFRKAPEKRFKICHIFGRKTTPIVLLQQDPRQDFDSRQAPKNPMKGVHHFSGYFFMAFLCGNFFRVFPHRIFLEFFKIVEIFYFFFLQISTEIPLDSRI